MVTLGLMQPYFAPHADYFRLIAACDIWLSYDTAQFKKHSWMSRNYLWHPTAEHNRVRFGLAVAKPAFMTPANAVHLANGGQPGSDWLRHALANVRNYRLRTPGVPTDRIEVWCDELSSASRRSTVTSVNMALIRRIAAHLGIETRLVELSEIDVKFSPGSTATEKIIAVLEHFGADCYSNAAGGRALYSKTDFESRGIELRFLRPQVTPSGYSILHDVLADLEFEPPTLSC